MREISEILERWEIEICKGNSSAIKVEAGDGTGVSFLGDKGAFGRRIFEKNNKYFHSLPACKCYL